MVVDAWFNLFDLKGKLIILLYLKNLKDINTSCVNFFKINSEGN